MMMMMMMMMIMMIIIIIATINLHVSWEAIIIIVNKF